MRVIDYGASIGNWGFAAVACAANELETLLQDRNLRQPQGDKFQWL
jgi:hypothetical protein